MDMHFNKAAWTFKFNKFTPTKKYFMYGNLCTLRRKKIRSRFEVDPEIVKSEAGWIGPLLRKESKWNKKQASWPSARQTSGGLRSVLTCTVDACLIQKKTKQNKTKQNKTKQNKTKQNKTKQKILNLSETKLTRTLIACKSQINNIK
jgi:hypothetical protein